MMTDRKRITVAAETFGDLRADKRDGETWDGYLRRLKREAGDGDGLDGETIRTIVRETADEVEARLR